MAQSIRDTLIDEPPFSVREGGFIRKGYNAEVDRLHEILSGGKGLLASIETKEKERTGIRTLKIGYNKVFGYYIEVSNSFKDLVPDTYIRKQTLVNGERYITEELKNLEQEILTAGDRDKALEFEIFTALRESVTAESVRIQRAAGPSERGRQRRHRNSRRPPPRRRARAQGRALRPERHLYGRARGPRRHHHRPQHGR